MKVQKIYVFEDSENQYFFENSRNRFFLRIFEIFFLIWKSRIDFLKTFFNFLKVLKIDFFWKFDRFILIWKSRIFIKILKFENRCFFKNSKFRFFSENRFFK